MISVTTVLDHFTEPEIVAWWRRKGFTACDKVSTEAKLIGSAVDLLIRQDLRGLSMDTISTLIPTQSEAVHQCLQAWRHFNGTHPSFRASVTGIQEELSEGDLVGHPDLIVQEPTRQGIIDVKTSRAIYPRYWTQVAAYLMLKVGSGLLKDWFVGILR